MANPSLKGYVTNIEELTLQNNTFRTVLYTAHYSQLVLMTLQPGEEIGAEVHGLDQFFRIEAGEGKAVINSQEHALSDGSAVVVPAGAEHNIINTGTEPLKLYTIYTPPEHKDGTIHQTKADAQEEHFDGVTSE